jgi:hypothetical protein
MPAKLQILQYSSNEPTVRQQTTVSGKTLIAAACFLFLLWCFYTAFWQFFSDQLELFEWVSVGWEKSGSVSSSTSLTPIPFAFGFGLFISSALFHWRCSHVTLLGASFPVLAGVWRVVETAAHSIGSSQSLEFPIVGKFVLVVFVQASIVYFAAWAGRPIAIFLANALLPTNLSATLRELWIDK